MSTIQRNTPQQAYILLAEDLLLNRLVVKNMIINMGHQVDSVKDGREALIAVSKNDYDLVFMDYQMPVMGGLEATKIIRNLEDSPARNREIPIIALTANSYEESGEACLNAGMNDYLTKPVNFELLEKTINKWLNLD